MVKKDVAIYDDSFLESYNVDGEMEECVFPFDLMVWHDFLNCMRRICFLKGSRTCIYLLLRWFIIIIIL